MTMAFEIQRQPFVQILHDGHGHWLTISSIGGKPGNTDISVYDSMYLSVGSYTKKQIAAIVCSKENTITLSMRNVQLQAGGSDCGVFAIAFATALANNINPCECCFKQDAMRDHLRRCLESGKLTMFPLVKSRMPRKMVRHVDIIELYCSCRMPEVPPMVECSKCKEWYHIKCVSVPKRALENQSIAWYCKNC